MKEKNEKNKFLLDMAPCYELLIKRKKESRRGAAYEECILGRKRWAFF